jgi:hypothetical protein
MKTQLQKRIILPLILLIIQVSVAQTEKGIQGSENWLTNWTNFKPATTDYKEPTIILSGLISENQTLFKKNTYLLSDAVYVINGATLTIEPGTVIRGDKETCGTLVITKGSKIIANGTDTDPIIFASNKGISERKAGDWGGIIILGDAPINRLGGSGCLELVENTKMCGYGGINENSNSGIIKYVRIEHAGRKLKNGKELNGLSLAGVGNLTIIDFVQISFSNDDSFECYGGNINLNNVISFKATDDDFDFTQGVQSKIKNSIAIRYPFISDKSKSRCFEIDSYDNIENTDYSKKMTTVYADNITLINNEENDQGLVKEAIYLKDKSTFRLENSVVSGFSSVIVIGNEALNKFKNIDSVAIKNSLINNCKLFSECDDKTNLIDYDLEKSNYFVNNQITKETTTAIFLDNNVKKNPDFRLKMTSNYVFSK